MIQFPGVRPREPAALKARWSKIPKLAISVYPWRDEPEVHTITNMNTHANVKRTCIVRIHAHLLKVLFSP